jgi:hypothetical protein
MGLTSPPSPPHVPERFDATLTSLEPAMTVGCRPSAEFAVCIKEFIKVRVKNQTELIDDANGVVRIACDTEFEGPHTLTIQFATRLGNQLAVQLYRSPAVPEPPPWQSLKRGFPDLRQWCAGVILRPVKVITRTLSPVRVLTDLYQLKGVKPRSRIKAQEQSPSASGVKALTLLLVAHYWPADFFRVFGRTFFANLVRARGEAGIKLYVQSNKLLGFREKGCYQPPVLEYVRSEEGLCPVRVKTFDTALPFGNATLDGVAKTFLDIQKSETITQQDKAHMRAAFHAKPADAYRYAVLDSVLTLLVEEKMREADQNMYLTLNFDAKEVPELIPTLGGRVAGMITRMIARTCAAGSVLLSKTGRPLKDGSVGVVSRRKVEELLGRGSGEFIAEENLSRFGKQTGETHGGLLFTRSPTKFFHAAPGQFGDIDLSGCYANIIAGMSLYVGQPVLHEPGSKGMMLRNAVGFLKEYAAGDDAWVVKVSGKITRHPNVLIPSTRDALTNANYQSRAAKKRAKSRRYGFAFDWLHEACKDTGGSTLYTAVVEAGVVAWSTWLMIQALPGPWREEYERLEVDTILFYPGKLVADSGPEYDQLVKCLATQDTAWSAKLDMQKLRRVIVEKVGGDFVSLRFSLGELAQKISEFRKDAKEKFGEKSGAELSWKQTANSIYGVSASKYLVTNNVVTANIITATARALAFAMQLSLNAFQVITDGCTYRRDQIPNATLAQCLGTSPDYPMLRVDECLSFVDPATVPQDDDAFTAWYRRHVKEFFGVDGPEYDKLFGIHRLEHKRSGGPGKNTFDGLCCDGSAQYAKLLKEGDGWTVLDFKARGYRQEAKEILLP